MNKRGGLMAKTLFLVILLAGISWSEAGDAFEPWEGKATTGLNVRSSPQVNARVIAWLQNGQKIRVSGEKEKWYKIVFEIGGEKFREGWVHGGYVQRIFPEKVNISSAPAKVRGEIVIGELQEKTQVDASTVQDYLPDGIQKDLDKASTSAATHVVEKPAPMTHEEGFLKGKKDARNTLPEKADVAREQPRAASQPESPAPEMKEEASRAPAATTLVKEQPRVTSQAESPVPEAKGGRSPLPATTPIGANRVNTFAQPIVPDVEKSLKQEPPFSHDRKSLNDAWKLKDLAKLVLRLLSIVLSCLAILLSYKAIKLAEISYKTAMQLQRDRQVRQLREDRGPGSSE